MTEQELRDLMRTRNRDVTLDNFADYAKEILSMPHDYGTICVAIGGLAAAAAWAANHEPAAGITGFQAQAVAWEGIDQMLHEFVEAWDPFLAQGPKRILFYGNMMYPQYADKFEKVINKATWSWLQEQATAELAEKDRMLSKAYAEHLQSIASGTVPFGYKVSDE